ncbi:MAG: fibronectin type III domain-containing protein, partial [Fimbriimonas ginsengisoli]|nr:fibronectin type III domain-containing protein [Fimbriimonas ginsengisoli]
TAAPLPPAPSAPIGVVATADNAQATLTWAVSAGATSHNVYYATTASGATVASATKSTGITGPSATINGLVNGTTYYFVVTAVNGGGEGAASAQATATPQAAIPTVPTGVTASAGNAQTSVTWAAVSGATTYNVYYATTASGATVASTTKSTGNTGTAATITGLTNGTTYYFAVRKCHIRRGKRRAATAAGYADNRYGLAGQCIGHHYLVGAGVGRACGDLQYLLCDNIVRRHGRKPDKGDGNSRNVLQPHRPVERSDLLLCRHGAKRRRRKPGLRTGEHHADSSAQRAYIRHCHGRQRTDNANLGRAVSIRHSRGRDLI